ncbi:hypothetical protein QCA50_020004 [Cerrena zonata]|uniref:Uncharacterized protein n=1 Tax=Cerrena zonata TaxID=2478898 RepID=A0AAW0FCM6_9APHY
MQNVISDDSSKGHSTKRPCVQVSNRSSSIAASLNDFHLTNTDDEGNKASPMQLTFNLPSMTAQPFDFGYHTSFHIEENMTDLWSTESKVAF